MDSSLHAKFTTMCILNLKCYSLLAKIATTTHSDLAMSTQSPMHIKFLQIKNENSRMAIVYWAVRYRVSIGNNILCMYIIYGFLLDTYLTLHTILFLEFDTQGFFAQNLIHS